MPIHQVQAPDGTVHAIDAPDGATPDQVMSFFQQNYDPSSSLTLGQGQPAPAPAPDFLDREGTDLSKRWQQIKDAQQREKDLGQSGASSVLQIGGTGAGAIADTIGNVVGSAARAVNNNLIPQSVDDAASSIGQDIMNSAPGQDFTYGAQFLAGKAGQLKQNHPITAADIGAVGNILSVIPAAKPAEAALDVTGSALTKAGEAASQMGTDQIANRQASFAKDLVMPKPTKAVLEDQVDRTTQSPILGRKIVTPSAAEQTAIDNVAQIPGVSKMKSFQANYNIINDAKNQEAEDLITKLKANDVAIPDDTIINNLATVRQNLAASPYVVGDGAKAAENTVNSALDIIQNHPQTASGLLQARKEFDSFIASQKGDKAFNPALESPITNAVQQVRQSINNMVDQAVPDAGVKASLAKQSSLYNALDNIAPKAAAEGSNRFSRLAQSASNALPIKNPIVKGGAQLAALGGVGSAIALAPALAAVPAVGYAGYKAASSPLLKKGVGTVLSAVGKVLSPKATELLNTAKQGGKVTINDIKSLPTQDGVALLQELSKTSPAAKDALNLYNKGKK